MINAIAFNVATTSTAVLTTWEKVTKICRVIYDLGQAVFLCLFGIKEIAWDTKQNPKPKTCFPVSPEKASKFERCLDWLFAKISAFTEKLSQYPVIHGGLYIASGITSIGSTLQGFGVLPATGAWVSLFPLSCGFFLFATVTSLCHYVTSCRTAIFNLTTSSESEKPKWEYEKTSAIIGIVNCICYIIASVIALFGGPMVAILIIGGLGAITGCIKLLYDFYCEFIQSKMKQEQQLI